MAVKYTEDQQKVIDLRNCNILVSAAAGSGKTAVLTERIIQRICDKENPIQIDRMLIVTFTNAAAAEMRERIGKAMRKKLDEEPDNSHLRKQLTLLNNAQITTIDSFCLYLLRNHFHEIQLDPAFRIADDGEVKLLQQETLEEYLEQKYDESQPEFLELIEKYAGNGKDKDLKAMLLQLHLFSQSNPFPEDYLNSCISELQSENGGFNKELEKVIYEYENAVFEMCREASCEAIALCRQNGGPYTYEEALTDDIEFYKRLAEATKYDERAQLYATHTFKAFSRKKIDDVDETIKEEVKDLREGCKKSIKDITKQFYYASVEEMTADNAEAGKTIAALLKCVLEFAVLFECKKREKNIVDFSDMEHLALKILLKKQGDEYVPSEVAVNYREYFEEIMVDEYQDSNQVQECLIDSISRQEADFGNRFMVGDVKQSIYRFRLARPEIFMEKYNAFDAETGKDRLVNLSMNFRSRREVIESVNAVCEQLMIPEVGRVKYDDRAKLYLGASYEQTESNYKTEVLLYNKEEFAQNHLTDVEAEAYILASHIKQLVGETLVKDSKTEKMRPAQFKDMVILLRKANGVDDIIKKILEKEGVPTYVASGTGYFAATEVKAILNYLTILDNPRQDIPLLGVMHSVFGKFQEEEIARIRIFNKKKGRLYDSLTEYALKGSDPCLRQKAEAFIQEIERWREETIYQSVYELMEAIFEKTGFLHYCTALPGGAQRKANLMVLLQKAKAFESGGYTGLFDFIRYMEMIKEKEVDFGEANILDANADVVRIMTIHKSKGLEFPICFVAGFGNAFVKKEFSSSLLMDADCGIAGDCIDLTLRCKRKTQMKNAIAVKKKNDSRGEDLRVLYVAMTRAKEKLILLGKGVMPEVVSDKANVYDILKAESFMDMVLPIALQNEDLFEIKEYTTDILKMQQSAEQVETGMLMEALKGLPTCVTWEAYEYPHTPLEGLYTKTTVSELKKAAYVEESEGCQELYQEEEFESYVPAFISEEEEVITGGRRGSAYHRVMELMDFTIALKCENMVEAIESVRKRSIEELRISAEDNQLVSASKVSAFMQTDLAKRMGEAQKKGKLRREQPFMIGVKANTVREEFPEEEEVLVQGVIDVYFEEEDGLVLMDYKTDRVSEAEELVKRYHTQLEYYAQALERLTYKKVKEKLIYSFALHQVIAVD